MRTLNFVTSTLAALLVLTVLGHFPEATQAFRSALYGAYVTATRLHITPEAVLVAVAAGVFTFTALDRFSEGELPFQEEPEMDLWLDGELVEGPK